MTLEQAIQELERRRPLVNEKYRPRFHLCVPAGWLNDPNGFSFFQGKVHLFYQYHPYDSVWGPMHWGHWVGDDLAHWREAPPALAPDSPFDSAGCFSGTAVEHDGRLMLIYTGVSPAPDGQGCVQQQCMAESTDGIRFVKWADNPVISSQMLPDGASIRECRDPKVEQTSNGYRVILASQGEAGGQLLHYASPDLQSWQYAGVYADHLGDMSECPDTFELNGKRVLIVCEMGADRARYGSPQLTLYAAGKEQDGRFAAEHPLEPVDRGMDFYAPQTALAPDGRRVLIGWALSWGHVMPTHTLGHGWAGMMTLPRECSLDDQGRLCQRPVREMEALRTQPVNLSNVELRGKTALPLLSGKHQEMKLTLDLKNAQHVNIRLMETGDECFELTYDCASGTLRADRSRCGWPLTADLQPEEKPWCEAKVPLEDGRLRLHLFVDASIVEIYADDGRVAMSCLAFPKGDAYGVSIEADGTMLEEACGWTMEGVMQE